jgi:hypothetical protein
MFYFYAFLEEHHLQLHTDIQCQMPHEGDCFIMEAISTHLDSLDHLVPGNMYRLFGRALQLFDIVYKKGYTSVMTGYSPMVGPRAIDKSS